MTGSGTGSLVFTDDLSAARSSRMKCEVYMAIVSAEIQPRFSKY